MKILPGRASYQIFGDRKQLVATVTEVEGRSVLDKVARLLPDSRMLMVAAPTGEPMMTLAYQGGKWLVEVTDADDSPIGKIRIAGSRRHYSLLDAEGTEIAQVVGDLAVKRFTVTGTNRPPFAEVKKTFAGRSRRPSPPPTTTPSSSSWSQAPGAHPDRPDADRDRPRQVRSHLGLSPLAGGPPAGEVAVVGEPAGRLPDRLACWS